MVLTIFFHIKRKREIKGKAKTRNINLFYEKTSFICFFFIFFIIFLKWSVCFLKKKLNEIKFSIDFNKIGSDSFHITCRFFKGVIAFSQFKKQNLNKKISKHFLGWKRAGGLSEEYHHYHYHFTCFQSHIIFRIIVLKNNGATFKFLRFWTSVSKIVSFYFLLDYVTSHSVVWFTCMQYACCYYSITSSLFSFRNTPNVFRLCVISSNFHEFLNGH